MKVNYYVFFFFFYGGESGLLLFPYHTSKTTMHQLSEAGDGRRADATGLDAGKGN